jgi:hypothetical protein
MVLNKIDPTKEELELIFSLIKYLIEKGSVTKDEMYLHLNKNEKDVDSILFYLEYLDFININENKISLKSHSYSLFSDIVLFHSNTESFIKNIFINQTKLNDNAFSIPAFLFPLLVVRAIFPYIGLILKDLDTKKLVKLSGEKKKFLFDFFSPFKYSYEDLVKEYKSITFTSEELYELWFALNRILISVINTDSKYGLTNYNKQAPYKKQVKIIDKLEVGKKYDANGLVSISRITEKEKPSEFIETYKIIEKEGQNELKNMVKIIIEKSQYITYINNKLDEYKLEKIHDFNINILKLKQYIEHNYKNNNHLKFNLYENAVEWIDEEKKLTNPSIYILHNGIYINKNDKDKLNSYKINIQIKYIVNVLKQIEGALT